MRGVRVDERARVGGSPSTIWAGGDVESSSQDCIAQQWILPGIHIFVDIALKYHATGTGDHVLR